MIVSIINTMIGPWGRAILSFYFAHQTIINILFVIWAGIITYASMQLNKIRHLTVWMSVDALKEQPELSDEQIWAVFRPKWQEEVAKLNAPFILNRWNIWIAKPTSENLIEVLRLSPEWFGAIRKGEVLPYRFMFQAKNTKLATIKRNN
jgi:hypothetical protein